VTDQKDKNANARTKWAEDRTLLATERTFSSWMGTGLGAVGIAIGLKAVFGAADPTWIAKLVASMFLGIAVLLFWTAQRQARISIQRLNQNDVEVQSAASFRRIAIVMTVATVSTGAVLWSL